MLNDLLPLLKSLESHGIAVLPDHPDVKAVKSGSLLRLRLDERGKIAGIEIDRNLNRWTIRDGQHNSFPALALPNAGLLRLDDAGRARINADWKAAKTEARRLGVLNQLLRQGVFDAHFDAIWPSEAFRGRLRERLESLRGLAADPATASVPAAFERFLAAEGLLRNLFDRIEEEINSAASDLMSAFFEILTGKSTVLIDVVMDSFGLASPLFTRSASDAWQRGPVSAELARGAEAGAPRGVCALTGRDAELQRSSFSQPNLPGLGQTYIFVRNDEIPAMERYGHSGSASFPVDASMAARIAGGLAYLVHADRQGKSWEKIPQENGTDVDLLIASLASAPDLKVAEFVSYHPEEDRADPDDGYVELTRQVIAQLGGHAPNHELTDHIDILLLRKVDLGNRKAIYHRSLGAAELAGAAERWQRANANVPDWLGFPVPSGLKSVEMLRPRLMSPLSIVRIAKKRYGEGQALPVKVGGISASMAFQCFLGEGDARVMERMMLAPLVSRYQPLFASLAAAEKHGTVALKELDPKLDLRWDGIRAAAWMGIVLHQMGRVREDYMSDAAFLLGQLLSAADRIHIRYCYAVRNGEIPPDLLGGSLLSMAGKDPMRALDLLCKRWQPYWNWGRRSGSLASDLSEIASQLRNKMDALEKPAVSDRFRAELLLGYLAGLPAKDRSDQVAESFIDVIEGEDDK